jgi:hypothetical protein
MSQFRKLHQTEQEFLRIVEELKEQEKLEEERMDSDYQMIIAALRLQTEGAQQLNKQIVRLNLSTTILASTQILLIIVGLILSLK